METTSGLELAIAKCERGESGFSCQPLASWFRLLIWGHVPEQWAGNLALHCFASALNIEAADSLRVDRDRWAASFMLKPRGDRRPEMGLDFLAMARRAPRSIPPLPESNVELTVESASDLGVFARVSGPDSIGLLAETLRRFAAFDLYPRRFELRTFGGHVYDWFWLEPIGRVRAARTRPEARRTVHARSESPSAPRSPDGV